jgi:phosphatidylserine decarboxylase
VGIRYWNRSRAREETEDVYGGRLVSLLYGNPLGLALADSLLAKKPLSRLYGAWQAMAWSGRKVAPFIRRFGVAASDFEPGPFRSFDDFFVRRFLPGRRSFPTAPGSMGAFAEARYLGYAALTEASRLPVKGLELGPLGVLGATPGKERFAGGPCLLARLCPVDYHRFHFPDSGRITHYHAECGALHSVNPLALEKRPGLFLANERQISLLQTDHFGLLAYVEVGAICVGRIEQTHPPGRPFARGGEKGAFHFGGSTVIVYGEPGAWAPVADLLENTALGREVLVELGQPVASALKKS